MGVEMKTYTSPVLRVHGKLEDLTHATGGSYAIDVSFSAGTPVPLLTFS